MRIVTALLLSTVLLFAVDIPQARAVEKAIDCDPEPPEATEMTIDYGDIVSCAIDKVADSDLFFFAGKKGDTVRIEVARVPPFRGFHPCLELRFLQGDTIETACVFAASNRIQLQLPKTGDYEIVVFDRSTDGIGGYHLGLERLAPPPARAGLIKYGDNLMDRIDLVVDSDPFVFTGASNDTVRIEIARVGNFSAFQPCIELFDSAGSALKLGCDFAGSNRINLMLLQDGDYTILVNDRLIDGFGDYNLALQCLAGTCRPAPKCGGVAATLVGTNGDNIIRGSNGRDVIVALGGNDTIYGLGGRDILCGGNGDDTIYGGAGNDVLYGQGGSDVLRGGAGTDVLWGGSGNDVLLGQSGNDKLFGQNGNDTLAGGGDEDRLSGGGGSDVCDGGQGSDVRTRGCELEINVP